MLGHSVRKASMVLGVASLLQAPQLIFHTQARDQPRIVEGVPDWQDKLLVQGDTVVILHLRFKEDYSRLDATLKTSRDTLTVLVSEHGPGGEVAVPIGGRSRAYEARIGPLRSGTYVVQLLDVGRYPADPNAVSLTREVVVR